MSLIDLGWDDAWSELFADYAVAGLSPARVVRPHRSAHAVHTEHGEVVAVVHSVELPTAGDWVVLDRESPPRIVEVLPRRTAIVRHGRGRATTAQVLAANVDVVFIAVALSSWPNLRRIERMLALAWESGAQPVVVLTKADLASDVEAAVTAVSGAALGVSVHVVSALEGTGVDELATYAQPGVTVAFIGASGVGKSTLVNTLVGAEILATRGLRNDDKGRHTTTHRELVSLPTGGLLLDTPGLKTIGLWDDGDGLSAVFSDIEELALECKFTDCGHDTEPGCAVHAAIANGVIESRRLDSYRKLLREQRMVALRNDARLRAEEGKKARVFYKAIRKQPHR